jgi:3-hydroxyacyl-CoA dehydrogenase
MHYADSIGLDHILANVCAFAAEDPLFWKPSPLLEELVARSANFNSLNQG